MRNMRRLRDAQQPKPVRTGSPSSHVNQLIQRLSCAWNKFAALVTGKNTKGARVILANAAGPFQRILFWQKVISPSQAGAELRPLFVAPVFPHLMELRDTAAHASRASSAVPHCSCTQGPCKACLCAKAGRSCTELCHKGKLHDKCSRSSQ